MMNLITMRAGARVHILVPWNDLHSQDNQRSDMARELGVENAPVVFLPINHG